MIIVGTGAGGGTLAQKLAPTGKRILILERGTVMALEDQNRADVDVFQKKVAIGHLSSGTTKRESRFRRR